MALENKENLVSVVPSTKGKSTANDELIAQGNAILAAMSDEERSNLASKSGTLHFVRLLGLQSKKAERVIAGRQTITTFKPVGIVLVSDEPISVPVIDITKNKDTGIDPATDITYRDVAAGEEFDLSYYEFMYLIIRDEYAGFCSRGDDPRGCFFSAKTPAYWRGEAKLPTPTICFVKEGSPKETMIAIDEQGPDCIWYVKEPYAEKYGALLKRKTPVRKGGSSVQTPKPIIISQALKKILGAN